jgi:hypothetical protein
MKIRVPRRFVADPDAGPLVPDGQLGQPAGGDDAPVPAVAIDGAQFFSLLADVATNAWKGQVRLSKSTCDELSTERKRLERNFESILSSLERFGVQVTDHTGQLYDYGQALKVVAAQPQEGIAKEVVTETIRPTVHWREQLIQRGEVVIATPNEAG